MCTVGKSLVCLLLISFVAAACAPGPESPNSAASLEVSGTVPAPGTLLAPPREVAAYPAVATLAARSVTVRYRSTSGADGSPTEVSGIVLVPRGDPPPGGWPVVSIGHATTGTDSR
ncbi:MAG: hypothetical protein WBF79_06325, partial [Rhodococcus sp. (in: high G+C Gram-positive bacteria)]